MSDLSNPIFHNEDAARQWLEARVWPSGPICPHCGTIDQATRLQGKTTRPGLHQCNACREPFTVTVKTLYERSKVPLHKWLHATHLLMASKKGMSALQIGRMLGLSKKTAWFVCHRIRESLRDAPKGQLGGGGKAVEADESYIGGRAKNRAHREPAPKKTVFTLVERGGEVRTQPVRDVSAKTLKPIITENINKASTLMTDEALVYEKIGEAFVAHGTVNHSANEYARAEWFHTNNAENYFSILKRGINGIYHHVSEQHLHRYCGEFDYRYNNRKISDAERMHKSVGGIVGKRLTYRRPDETKER
jgi:transposase-like protein